MTGIFDHANTDGLDGLVYAEEEEITRTGTVFLERAIAVRSADGAVAILLADDRPTMKPGYLMTDTAPVAWLRFTDNGLIRLSRAVDRALAMRGLENAL